ncbi:APC family permease [Parasphingorhabdus pacifica]
MSKLVTTTKRLLVGRPFRSDRLSHTLLPKRLALPVFATDAMSSVAYAPEEIFLVLSVAGLSAYTLTPWVGAMVAIVMLTVVASYRQNVRAYPSGGGDYEVAKVNLGHRAGLTVASALMVDYTLTVAVSISSAAANIGSLVPFVATHKVAFALAAIAVLTAISLRGVRESGGFMAFPVYAFLVGVLGMIAYGLVRALVLDERMRAESASVEILPDDSQIAGAAFVFLVLRAFSQGAAALTGVEAISNGVPAFRKPKPRNAAKTLLLMGTISVTMLMGLIFLAQLTGVRMAENPAAQIVDAPPGYDQKTMIAQIANAVFDGFPAGAYFVTGATAVILILAANTAFNGFPVLGSILAQDRFLPRQLHTRGDRLAFSNGILFLAAFAGLLVWIFDAEVTRLVHLYVVGVFVSFTIGQAGMVRHWQRALREESAPAERRRMRRAQAINTFGLLMTGSVLLIVLTTKFAKGSWIAVGAMIVFYGLMTAIRKHYDRVAEELTRRDEPAVLPSRNYAIVLVSQVHLPTLRALAYARATRPDTLEAVTVNVDDEGTRVLTSEWDAEDLSVPLKVIESPYREVTRPLLEYVKRIRRNSPRDVVTVFIPEYVLGHWWEQLLHNQSALRIKARLLFEPGVMVTSVPWQLASSARAKKRGREVPSVVRRGRGEDMKENDQK